MSSMPTCRNISTPFRTRSCCRAWRVASMDRHVLHLLKMWLKAPIEERDERGGRRMSGGKRSTRGTPQGGVISPLLANIYMHRFLRAWRQRDKGCEFRARLITYADDFVIVSRGQAAAALTWTHGVMERIGLTLNDAKTSIRNARTESFDFLGYTFGPDRYRRDGHWYLAAKPSKKSVQRVKAAVRAVLHPGNHQRWPEVSTDLNRRLRGWSTYFSVWYACAGIPGHRPLRLGCGVTLSPPTASVCPRGARSDSAPGTSSDELGVLRLTSRLLRAPDNSRTAESFGEARAGMGSTATKPLISI